MTILRPAISQSGFTGLSFGLGLVFGVGNEGDHYRVEQVHEKHRYGRISGIKNLI